MSAVSYPLPSPSPDPVPLRRRAPEADSGRDAAPFSLPEEPAAEARPAAEAKDDAKASEPAVQKPVQDKADSTGAQAAPAKPAAGPAAAKPVQSQPADAAAPASVQPKPDVGALVAIAEAAQAAAGGVGETNAKPKKAEGEGKAEVKAKEGETADAGAALPMPMPDPASAQPVQPAPVLPVGSEAVQQPAVTVGDAPAPVSAEAPGVQGASGQQAVIQLEVVPVVPVPAVPPGAAFTAAGGEAAPEPDPASAPASDKRPRLAVTAQLPFDAAALGLTGATAPGTDASLEKVTGEVKSAEAANASHAKAGGAEASTSAAPAEIGKPAETAQQQPNLTPIDFSALLHSRAGRSDAPVLPTGLDPAATAQAQLANGQHNAADGQPTPLHVVPVEIGLRALAGSKRFDIRLDPAELGRIDVKLEISDAGEVSAKLVVDRVETLHLLQRDARTLERAFEQAGLKPSDAGVDITLRDQSDQSGFRQNRQDEQAPQRARPGSDAEIDDIAIAAQPVPVRRLVRLGGVDLSI
ncbi:flagellar hook-length control protein FliK [Bosea caraganae]|uniref:Flagellar hook-length control protein FliK n=1 Tax=Bosea caraganae TaxID=2763117 RepID=A0A370L6L2_9HYPH|nr:flagellar hook-length control protein FliK [Bosea caraganae]RDJ25389.1 flagellar hook-length control protein FliK [Bosea caraganae]RDJ25826.1 flagellar hook-length control protein FliK [Bosea caraganae]